MALKRIIYLTNDEYGRLKNTGSVTIGIETYTPDPETEFRVIAETPKKYYIHDLYYDGTDGNFSLRFLSTKDSAISKAEFFTKQFTAGFLNGWAYGDDSQIYVVTNVECDSNNYVYFYSGEGQLREYSDLSEPIQDTFIEL